MVEREQFACLLERGLSGELSVEERTELNCLMREFPELRREYVGQIWLEKSLQRRLKPEALKQSPRRLSRTMLRLAAGIAILCSLGYAAITTLIDSDEVPPEPPVDLSIIPAYSVPANTIDSSADEMEPSTDETSIVQTADRSTDHTQTGDNEMNISQQLAAAVTAAALTAMPFAHALANSEPVIWNYYASGVDGVNYARITDGQWVLRVSAANKTLGTLTLGEGYGITNAYVSGQGNLDLGNVICRDASAGVDYRITSLSAQSAFEQASNIVDFVMAPDVEVLKQRSFRDSGIRSFTVHSESLKQIDSSVFLRAGLLTNAWIDAPNLTSIGAMAFMHCSNLAVDVEHVLPPSVVTWVEERHFDSCRKLTGTIRLPNAVRIPKYAFIDCSSIEAIEIINPVLRDIADSAFQRLTSLTNAWIEAPRLTNIGAMAFMHCSNLAVNVEQVLPPSLVTLAGERHFDNCRKLTGTIRLPNVVRIPKYAFIDCSRIEAIELINPVLGEISDSAFQRLTSLTNALIDAPNLTNMGAVAFSDCSNLAVNVQQVLPPSITTWTGERHFGNCRKLTGSVVLPKATSLPANIFNNCTGIEALEMTNPGLTSFTQGGEFSGCVSLTNIILGATNAIEVIKETSFFNVSPNVKVTFWGPAPKTTLTFSAITGGNIDPNRTNNYTACFYVSRRQEGWLDVAIPLTEEEKAIAPPKAFGTVEGVVGSYRKRIWLIAQESPYDRKPTICIIH